MQVAEMPGFFLAVQLTKARPDIADKILALMELNCPVPEVWAEYIRTADNLNQALIESVERDD